MGKHQQKIIQPLAGKFLGWGDERIPHRYIKLATTSGEQVVKVAKSLRPLIQEWQPGIWLTLLGQKQVNLTTGKIRIKVKQILTPPTLNDLSPPPNRLSTLAAIEPMVAIGDRDSVEANTPTQMQIRVCQGSSCRRRGSDGICRAMQTYLDRNELTERVEIKPVKCLHQCKAAPHAIVTQLTEGSQPEKTHYRQLQHYQVQAILDRVASRYGNRQMSIPLAQPQPTPKWLGQIVTSQTNSIEDNLITKIGNYLQHQIGSTSTAI